MSVATSPRQYVTRCSTGTLGAPIMRLGFVLVGKTVDFCDLLQCQQYHVRIHPHQVVLAPLTEFLIGSGVYVLHLLV